MRSNTSDMLAVFILTVASLVLMLILGQAALASATFPSHLLLEMARQLESGDAEAENLYYAVSAMQAAHWFNAATIPGLTGILVGMLIGPVRLISGRSLLFTAIAVSVVLVAFYGPRDVAAWLGAALYSFCLTGGASATETVVARFRPTTDGHNVAD